MVKCKVGYAATANIATTAVHSSEHCLFKIYIIQTVQTVGELSFCYTVPLFMASAKRFR